MTVTAIGIIPEWEFCDRLRKARRISGLSQEQMCAELGVLPSRYGHWESGRNQPDNLRLTALAVSKLTGVSFAWLMGSGDGDDNDGLLLHLDSNQEPCD